MSAIGDEAITLDPLGLFVKERNRFYENLEATIAVAKRTNQHWAVLSTMWVELNQIDLALKGE